MPGISAGGFETLPYEFINSLLNARRGGYNDNLPAEPERTKLVIF